MLARHQSRVVSLRCGLYAEPLPMTLLVTSGRRAGQRVLFGEKLPRGS